MDAFIKRSSPSKQDSTPDEVCFEFDRYQGRKWIYPNNMPVRSYQKQAVKIGLFNNAMIVLPTGFGKTFIAAVVMYNFYRWYPQGKIIFVAPTRPLVTQQMVECKKISGIPPNDCVELTGTIPSDKRRDYWATKRVFFATPQVIENDLNNNNLPGSDVRCLVLDEAHRAQGSYAYVGIVRTLHERNMNGFRILALSATPGSDIERVKQVMLNLYISEVMFRSENSIDLQHYGNQKCSKAWTVELPPKHQALVQMLCKVADPFVKVLYRAGLTYSGDTLDKVARFVLIKAGKALHNHDQASLRMSRGKASYYCAAASSLKYQFELLTIYGIRVFYSSVMKALNESKNSLKSAVAGSVEFTKILDDIRATFGEDVEPDPNKKPKVDLLLGHPKLATMRDLLMEHFKAGEAQQKSTRAIVFTRYRESVLDIVQTLRVYEPLIKAAIFVGQAGMKQKEQIAMIKEFKDGKYNVLVATCVAEEGLDIGEVDLIICYDTSSSPISNTQRRGRTGRKRSGDVRTLLTKGYEEKKLQNAGASRRQVEDQLFRRENYIPFRYRNAPKMVPPDIEPECFEQKIFALEEDEEVKVEEKPKRKRRRTVKADDEKACCEEKKKCSEMDEVDGCLDVDDEDNDVTLVEDNNDERPPEADKNIISPCDPCNSDDCWDENDLY